MAGEAPWRDEKRAKSAAEMTGSGTAESIASSTVQRPSPESSTQSLICSSDGSYSRALTSRSSSHDRTTVPRLQALRVPGTSVTMSFASSSSKPSA
jgi:hypothetical protein